MDPLAETSAPATPCEKLLINLQLVVHLTDVALHGLVAAAIYLSPSVSRWCVVLVLAIMGWSAIVSSCYIAFGQKSGGAQITAFFTSMGQIQIIREARKAIRVQGESDYFQTLRLIEGVLESAPLSVVTLYLALLADSRLVLLDPRFAFILLASGATSIISLASSLVMWEHRVCLAAQSELRTYLPLVAGFRLAEITSRVVILVLLGIRMGCRTLLTAVGFDFVCMLSLVSWHGSVQYMYCAFVAVPLVLVSLEPVSWKRKDHAAPKEFYYPVRIAEFIVMWCVISDVDWRGNHRIIPSLIRRCYSLALCSTLIMYVLLPCVWHIARKRDLHEVQNAQYTEHLQSDNCEEWKKPYAAFERNPDSASDSDDSGAAAE